MRVFKISMIVVGALVGLALLAAMYLGASGPDTAVYAGDKVPAKYLRVVKSLELLEEGEKSVFFYSDGLMDIKDGMYFVTDRHLVLYSDEWDEPKTIIPYEYIIDMKVEHSESWIEDTYITLETLDYDEITFPVSAEKGGDRKFIQFIRNRMKVE